MSDMHSLDQLDKKLETPSGHALWKVYVVIISLIMATFLGMIFDRVNEGHKAVVENYIQDKQIALLQSQTTSVIQTQAAFQQSNQQALVLMARLQQQQTAIQETQKRILNKIGE